MDKRWSLWEYEEEEEEESKKEEKEDEKENGADNEDGAEKCKEIKNEETEKEKLKNPFLLNINEYLVEETNAEEEELLNANSNSASDSIGEEQQPIKFEKDLNLAKVLDRLILYLRIVHSIDFYNITEYQQEDLMPNRLGILHARDKSQPDKKILKSDIDEWIKQFEINIKPYVEYKDKIEVEMAKRLGLKDPEVEVEKFLNENCKELEKDKWLCPLSGKKFKAKEYVHKHIMSKHADKIDNVRKLCEFFNCFVFDPKRPYLPEHPLTRLNNTNNNNNSNNVQNNDQNPQQQKPYYQNRYMQQQTSQQSYFNQNALLPTPSMHHYQNRPNYYQQQNYGYRPNAPPMHHHNMRFKK